MVLSYYFGLGGKNEAEKLDFDCVFLRFTMPGQDRAVGCVRNHQRGGRVGALLERLAGHYALYRRIA